ncbi:MAG: rhodanese-like protein [Cyanobacteria bacterium RYN_339]|nr:rhodanese-like protein [Cyanobacteria bacterium RYN_339]
MIVPTVSTSASLAIALWAIVMLGALSPSSVPREGPLVSHPFEQDLSPKSTYQAKRMTAPEAKTHISMGEKFVLVDVRAPESYAHEHIEGAINSPWRDLAKGYGMLPKDKLLLLYCT